MKAEKPRTEMAAWLLKRIARLDKKGKLFVGSDYRQPADAPQPAPAAQDKKAEAHS